MLEITQEKKEMIQQLLKKGLPHKTLIKLISSEINEAKKTFELTEILFFINNIFEVSKYSKEEIKYSNFQRMLHRLKPSDNKSSHSNDIYGNNIDDDDLI